MYEQCEELIESTPKNTNFNTPSANRYLNKRFVLLETLSPPKSMQYLAKKLKNSLEIFIKYTKFCVYNIQTTTSIEVFHK